MRKLRYLLLTLSLLTVSVGAFAYDGDGFASKKRQIEDAPASFPYREYQLVRYAEMSKDGVGLSAGDVVVRDTVSKDGVTVGIAGTAGSVDGVVGVVVSKTIPTCDAGGLLLSTDFGRRNWGYIQVRGYCNKVNINSGPAVAGGVLFASQQPRYATGSTALITGDGTRSMGFAYNTSSSGQDTAEISL